MNLVDRFLSTFAPKGRRGRRRPYWTTSIFPKKVKEMVKLSEVDAETQSARLLEALLKMHRDTNLSECKVDDELLELISKLMKGDDVEKRTVEEITFRLYLRYAKELFNKIMEFIEWSEDTYINFDETSEILNRAKRVMGSTQLKQADLESIVNEMIQEHKRLEDKEDRIENKSYRIFLAILISLWTVEAALFGTFRHGGVEFLSNIVNVFMYFYAIAVTSWFIFKRLYKRFVIVGKSKIFSKHEYFEENEIV
jgi:hypothetical protein